MTAHLRAVPDAATYTDCRAAYDTYMAAKKRAEETGTRKFEAKNPTPDDAFALDVEWRNALQAENDAMLAYGRARRGEK